MMEEAALFQRARTLLVSLVLAVQCQCLRRDNFAQTLLLFLAIIIITRR